MNKTLIVIKVYDIQWDKEAEKPKRKVPTNVYVEMDLCDLYDNAMDNTLHDLVVEQVEAHLDETYGWGHCGFNWMFA